MGHICHGCGGVNDSASSGWKDLSEGCFLSKMDSHLLVRIIQSSIRFMEESLNFLLKESMCVHGGALATHDSAKDSCCPDYHLLDNHLSSPGENAVCSTQLLSEGHLYSSDWAFLNWTGKVWSTVLCEEWVSLVSKSQKSSSLFIDCKNTCFPRKEFSV